jgi:acyl-CoA synthetase (AMP-forming)/AMP-acid ligase II
VAFLQYTSGSTGSSKGVQLSHRNLVANLRQMIAGSQMTDADVIVSWLPVYHDLGLILMTMAPFYLAAKLVLMQTTLTSMGHWLDTIAAHGGTYTAAPDIGYRMVLKQVRDASKYDISTLRVAINAAEPVRVQTVQDFEAKFGIGHVIKPGYGLAEASVGVSFWGLDDKPIKYDDRGFVSIGKPLPDITLKVVNGDAEVPTGEIGELVFLSPAATRGYFKNPDATEALFWKDDFLHTGDMAYVDDEGDFFIVARSKNMIKQGGRTLAPSEIEELIDRIPKVRYCAAVGIDRGGYAGEQAYVFAETRVKGDDAPALVQEIVRTINEGLGFRRGRVALVKPETGAGG